MAVKYDPNALEPKLFFAAWADNHGDFRELCDRVPQEILKHVEVAGARLAQWMREQQKAERSREARKPAPPLQWVEVPEAEQRDLAAIRRRIGDRAIAVVLAAGGHSFVLSPDGEELFWNSVAQSNFILESLVTHGITAVLVSRWPVESAVVSDAELARYEEVR